MNLKVSFNKAVRWGKQNSPDILLVTGLIEGAVGTVLACRATLKAKEILEEPSIDTKPKKAVKIVKTYSLSAALMAAAGLSICEGFDILKKSNKKALAACGAISASLMAYRERVREEVGKDKEEELYYGTKKETISVKIPQEDGSKKTVRKKLDIREQNGLSPYAKKFDPMKACGTEVPYYIDAFLQREESYLDDTLKAYGHLYLNEANRRLWLEEDDVGQVVGWIFDPYKVKDGDRDNYVKLIKKEIFIKDEDGEWHSEIWIDFNVDGVIFGKMSREEYRADKGVYKTGNQGLEFSNKEE